MPIHFDFYDDIETESTGALTEDQFARMRQRFDERFFTITCLDPLSSTAIYDRRTGRRVGGSWRFPGKWLESRTAPGSPSPGPL